MAAYTYRMPSGFAGMITRVDTSDTEAQTIDSTTPPTSFGIPVKMVAGKIQPLANGDAATVIYGFLARPFPFQGRTYPARSARRYLRRLAQATSCAADTCR